MVTRDELYDLVWTEPTQNIAKRFNVSGSYLARVCERLKIPTPAKGYWAKHAAGKIMARPALPEPRVGDEISWKPGGGAVEIFSGADIDRVNESGVSSKNRVLNKNSTQIHELLKDVKPLYLSGGLSRQNDFLKPTKRLLPDIHASKIGIERILEFANLLFNALENKGFRVGFEAIGSRTQRPNLDVREKTDEGSTFDNFWSPARNTVIFIKDIRVGITIFELTESIPMRYINGTYVKEIDYIPTSKTRDRFSWVSNQDNACGRFGVQIYASYFDQHWSKIWREKKTGEFERKINSIVLEISSQYSEVIKVIQVGKAHLEAQRLRDEEISRMLQTRWEQEQLAKRLKESQDALFALRSNFEESERWDHFFAHIADIGKTLSPEESVRLLRQIEEMKKLIGTNIHVEHYLNWSPPNPS